MDDALKAALRSGVILWMRATGTSLNTAELDAIIMHQVAALRRAQPAQPPLPGETGETPRYWWQDPA